MKAEPKMLQNRASVALPIQWQEAVWFPPVLLRSRLGGVRRRPVFWPHQIITDPTTCQARAIDI